MLGNNPVRPQELNDGKILWIQELFYTLQGEGPFSGEPAVFVRTAGCDLKCFWCDTDFESSTWHPTLEELLERIEEVRSEKCDLIVLTGGEPFRQNIRPLVEELLQRKLRVQIETNGTLWVDLPKDPNLTIVCSPKTSTLHKDIVPRINAYKYVIAADEINPEDGLPSTSTQKQGTTARICRPSNRAEIFVMPRDDQDVESNAKNRQACAEIAMKQGYRLCLQTHKIMGLN